MAAPQAGQSSRRHYEAVSSKQCHTKNGQVLLVCIIPSNKPAIREKKRRRRINRRDSRQLISHLSLQHTTFNGRQVNKQPPPPMGCRNAALAITPYLCMTKWLLGNNSVGPSSFVMLTRGMKTFTLWTRRWQSSAEFKIDMSGKFGLMSGRDWQRPATANWLWQIRKPPSRW